MLNRGNMKIFGIHANILATYLRGNGVIPEKVRLKFDFIPFDTGRK